MSHIPRTIRGGAILLEVIFAIVLFASASAVTIGGLSWSARSVESVKLAAEGSDLALSVLSRVQMGEIDLATAGPFGADRPHDQWQWEMIVSDAESFPSPADLSGVACGMSRIEIIVTHNDKLHVSRLVRLVATTDEDALEEPEEPETQLGGRL